MQKVTRALVGAIVASLVAAVRVYAAPPTEVDLAFCNTDAQAAMKAGTATPTTKDYVRVESARTDSAATWTTWVGPISMESSDPQLIGMATDGITDAGVIRRTAPGSAGMGSGRRLGGDGTAV